MKFKIAGLIVAFSIAAVFVFQPAGASTREAGVSPLSAYLGFGYHSDAEEATYESEEADRQRLLVDCMRKAGFDYTAVDSDFAESGTDENHRYYGSLSPKEQPAYHRALTGRDTGEQAMSDSELEQLDSNGDGEIELSERAGMGCLGEVETTLPGVFRVRMELTDELEKLDETIETAPDVVAAQSEWIACMNQAGLDGETDEEVAASVLAEAEELGRPSDELEDKVQVCNRITASARASATVEAEKAFFEANRESIEQWAYPAP